MGYEPGEDSDGPDRPAGDNTDDGISNHGHGALKKESDNNNLIKTRKTMIEFSKPLPVFE